MKEVSRQEAEAIIGSQVTYTQGPGFDVICGICAVPIDGRSSANRRAHDKWHEALRLVMGYHRDGRE